MEKASNCHKISVKLLKNADDPINLEMEKYLNFKMLPKTIKNAKFNSLEI